MDYSTTIGSATVVGVRRVQLITRLIKWVATGHAMAEYAGGLRVSARVDANGGGGGSGEVAAGRVHETASFLGKCGNDVMSC